MFKNLKILGHRIEIGIRTGIGIRIRVRIGIGKPKTKSDVSDHVLKDFDEDEIPKLEEITNNIIDSISLLIDKKLDLFSSTVNNK